MQRLQQADGGYDEYRAVRHAACGYQHEPHEGEQYEHFGREEYGVDVSQHEEQHQPPAEPESEIASLEALVIVLNEETESEEQGEDGVGLAAEGEEEPVPDGLVGEVEQRALLRGVGEGVEVVVLDGVQQHDAHHGEAAQNVGYVDS